MRSTLLALLPLAALAAIPDAAEARGRGGHERYYAPPAEGRVVVDNRSGGTVTVSLAGRTTRIAAWEKASLYAPIGETTVRATYQQFGATHLLETERVTVDPWRSRYVVLEPERTARVLVTNDTPLRASLEVNDRYHSELQPHESRLVAVPVGRVELELTARGREIEEKNLDARPFAEHRWTVHRPSTGTFMVDNDHGRPVRLVIDGETVRTLRPDEDVRLDVDLGWHRVAVRDDVGRLLLDRWIEVEPYDTARVSFGDDRAYVADAGDRHDRDDRRDDRDRGEDRHHRN